MKIVDKLLYFCAIWFVIVGFIGILMGVQFYANAAKNLDDLPTIKGAITDIQYRDIYDKELGTTHHSMVIYIDSVVSVYTFNSRNLEILKENVIQKGDYCQVWFMLEARRDKKTFEVYKYRMRALDLNNEKVIEFKNQSYLAIYIFLYALILIVPALLFVLKDRERIFGNNTEGNSAEENKPRVSLYQALKNGLLNKELDNNNE